MGCAFGTVTLFIGVPREGARILRSVALFSRPSGDDTGALLVDRDVVLRYRHRSETPRFQLESFIIIYCVIPKFQKMTKHRCYSFVN